MFSWLISSRLKLPAVWHGLLVKDSLLKADPQSVRKIEEVLRQAVAKVRADPEEQVQLLIKYERLPEAWVRAAVASQMNVFSEQPLTLTEGDKQDAMRIWDYMYTFGYMTEKVTAEQMFWEWK